MGSSASKPARAAANAASRRQYPKQPVSPTTAPPTGAPKQAPRESPQEPKPAAHGPAYHSKEQPSSVKSDGMYIFPHSNISHGRRRCHLVARNINPNHDRPTNSPLNPLLNPLNPLNPPTLSQTQLTRYSNRPRRPRPSLRRLPPEHRPRKPSADALALEHLQPTTPTLRTKANGLSPNIQPGASSRNGSSTDNEGRRARSRRIRETEPCGS